MIRYLAYVYMNGIGYVFYMFDCEIWDVIRDLVYVYINGIGYVFYTYVIRDLAYVYMSGIDHVFYTYQSYLWLITR